MRPYAKFGLNELVVADIEDLRWQVWRCWKVPAVTRKEDFDLHVRIELRPDGSVPATGVTALATNGAANAIPYASVFENQGRNEAYSVFADVTWLATDSLELTAGARLLEDVPTDWLTGRAWESEQPRQESR